MFLEGVREPFHINGCKKSSETLLNNPFLFFFFFIFGGKSWLLDVVDILMIHWIGLRFFLIIFWILLILFLNRQLSGTLNKSNECSIQGPKLCCSGGGIRRLLGSPSHPHPPDPPTKREIKFPLIDFNVISMHNGGFGGRLIPLNCGGWPLHSWTYCALSVQRKKASMLNFHHFIEMQHVNECCILRVRSAFKQFLLNKLQNKLSIIIQCIILVTLNFRRDVFFPTHGLTFICEFGDTP